MTPKGSKLVALKCFEIITFDSDIVEVLLTNFLATCTIHTCYCYFRNISFKFRIH